MKQVPLIDDAGPISANRNANAGTVAHANFDDLSYYQYMIGMMLVYYVLERVVTSRAVI